MGKEVVIVVIIVVVIVVVVYQTGWSFQKGMFRQVFL